MAIASIEKASWARYFDGIAGSLEGKSVEIDIEALSLGSQIGAEWLPLLGITYEARDDMLAVMVEGLNHLIRHPQTVHVDVELGQLSSLSILDSDGVRHILKLRDPLRLPEHY